MNQLENIPPVQFICSGYSSYLLDFGGNVWSFGNNDIGQLGLGDILGRKVPTKVESVKDILQISCGSTASYLLLKDSDNAIFILHKVKNMTYLE